MSIVWQNQLDDPILDAGSGGWDGVNSRLRPALIDDAKLSKGKDCIIGETGMVQTRFPAKTVGSPVVGPTSHEGLSYFDIPRTLSSPALELIIAGINKRLYSVDHLRVPTWTDLGHEVLGDVHFSQLVNKMSFTDSKELWNWDGNLFKQVEFFNGTSSKIPQHNSLITQVNRLILAAIDDPDYFDDALYASDVLDGDTWIITNSIRIGGGNGDPIRVIVRWHENFIAVLKKRSIWIVNATGSVASWTIEHVTDTLGCIAADTAIQVGNDIWFLSAEGLTSLRRANESIQREMSTIVLNTPVNDLFERINKDAVKTSCAGFFNNRYYISVPTETSEIPNETVVYNTLTTEWEGPFTGTLRKPFRYSKSSFLDRDVLIWQNNNHEVVWQDERPIIESTDFLDLNPITLTEDIDIEPITKAYDFQHPKNFKQLFNLELDFFNSSGTVDIFLIPDEDEGNILTVATNVSTSESPALPINLPFNLSGKLDKRLSYGGDLIRKLNRFKEVRVKIVGNGAGVKLRRVALTAFLDTVEIHNQGT